ncbi:MAG: hypothetical protein A2161_06410 [Candidatus Schekmanbacteria bacterium RBG_13_48_7]|uniref:DUF5666 domain-containing protein n=1 Tax=Candidatus Schekmanbacteria bacterium RBG_13_48_7 TaxID=1817878 RepID=A0A1F7RZR3_9BACT|nr:MAG: hypothetical protein A2161_06410 [Candidatus Schekmanbacteria bacterium RBG_13_48_7]
MKIGKCFISLLFICLVTGNINAGGLVPHAIYGQILLPDEITRADTSNLLLDAFVIDRPDEIITESTGGCRINTNGSYVVECSAFPTLAPGDIVQVEIYDWDFNLLSIVQVELGGTGTDRIEISLFSDDSPKLLDEDFEPQELLKPELQDTDLESR